MADAQTRLCSSDEGGTTYLVAVHGDRMATVRALPPVCCRTSVDDADSMSFAQLCCRARTLPYTRRLRVKLRMPHANAAFKSSSTRRVLPDVKSPPRPPLRCARCE